jgi:hypothetical protein
VGLGGAVAPGRWGGGGGGGGGGGAAPPMTRLGPAASAQPKVPLAEPGTKFRPAVIAVTEPRLSVLPARRERRKSREDNRSSPRDDRCQRFDASKPLAAVLPPRRERRKSRGENRSSPPEGSCRDWRSQPRWARPPGGCRLTAKNFGQKNRPQQDPAMPSNGGVPEDGVEIEFSRSVELAVRGPCAL